MQAEEARLAPGQVTYPGLVCAVQRRGPAPPPDAAAGAAVGETSGCSATPGAAMGAPACAWEGSALPQHQPSFISSFNYYTLMKVF